MRRAALALASALFLVPSALAAADCTEPYGPVLPDKATATPEDLDAVKDEVIQFIKDSDAYQSCLVATMNDPDAKKDEKMTDAQKAAIARKIDANQKEKEAIGNGYNELVRAVNARAGKK